MGFKRDAGQEALIQPIMDRFADKPVYRGIDCGYGWYPLLLDLHDRLVGTDPDYRVVQVKEKFGGLRFYTEYRLSDAGEALLREAEALSHQTCETCGLPARTRSNGYMITLCDDCHGDFERYCAGALVQNAFPELPIDGRPD